jgi:hypothetical protein
MKPLFLQCYSRKVKWSKGLIAIVLYSLVLIVDDILHWNQYFQHVLVDGSGHQPRAHRSDYPDTGLSPTGNSRTIIIRASRT